MGKIRSRILRERSYDCHYRCRAIRSNYRGHQAKSKTVEHSFDDVDNRGWLRTSDILPVPAAPRTPTRAMLQTRYILTSHFQMGMLKKTGLF